MNAELLYDYSRVQPRAPKSWTIEAIKPFVYVGHYIPGKGQDVALEAFAIAAAKNPSLRLLFYGGCMGLAKNRAYKAGLEARSRALGLEDRVAFHDAVTESHSVLAFAYAALNFSASESFSMTVLEASGSGVPVLATRSGGPQEIIVDGSTGYLVPVGDIEAAAAGMERLASTPELAETMGASAARHVAERFNEEAFRHRLHALVA